MIPSVGLIAGLVMLGTTPAAHEADPPPSRLAWEAPAECSARSEVVAKIEELVGSAFDAPRAQGIQARGRVVRTPGSWVLELSLTTSSGTEQRILQTKTCAALVEAAAVVIAIAIDPAVMGPPATPPAPAASAEPSPPPVPPPSDEPARSETHADTGSGLGGYVRAVGGISAGPLPAVAPVAGLGVGLRRPWLRVELMALHGFAQDAQSPWGVGRIQQWSVIARACALPAVGRFEFPLCGGPELGVMSGRGRGVTEARVGRALWGALNLSPGIVFRPTPRVGLGVQVDVVVPWSRPGFAIDGGGEVHRANAVGLYALGGIEVHFP